MPEKKSEESGSTLKWVIGAAVLVALVLAYVLLPIKEWVEAFQGWIEGLGAWGYVMFALVYVVGTVLLVPVSVLTVVAGLAFGLAIGFPLVVVSATIGATLAFLVARYLVHGWVDKAVAKRPKFKAVNAAVSEGGWKIVALLRLSPVLPFNLQNYFYGITDLTLAHYVPATFFGIMPGTLLYVYLGAAGKAAAGAGGGPLKWTFFAVGLIATIVVAVLVTKKAKEKLKDKGVGGDGDGQGGADGKGGDGDKGGAANDRANQMADTAHGKEGAAARHESVENADETLKVDLCVIGAGSAGLSATSIAAQLGVKVVLIERAEMGGECLNIGCVPSKALLAASKAAHAMRSIERFGIAPLAEPQIDFAAVQRHVQSVIAAIAPHDSVERFEGLGAQVIRGEARFVEPRVLMVGNQRIEARRIIIATGSAPATPPIDGLAQVDHFTNENIFDNRTLPEHLLIIGGGAIGMEMAQAHRRLGSRVTVVETAAVMAHDERELVDALLEHFAAEGIEVRQKVKVDAVRKTQAGIELTLGADGQKSTLEGTHLLVAAGRRPRLDALDLQRAGIEHDKGGIVVDAHLQTNVHGVYAIGDVVSKAPRFTHVSGYHAGIAAQNALTINWAKTDYAALPWVTFTDPELAHVGATEAEARKKHGDDVKVVRSMFSANDRAQTEGETLGQVKVVARGNGEVLGVSILGAHAGELIHVWVLAIQAGLKLKQVARLFAPYPTLGEANKGAAGEFYKPRLFGPWPKRIVGWMSKLP
ncbi:MAG: FAD-dependent oxidoreductase [Variovorax sp.]